MSSHDIARLGLGTDNKKAGPCRLRLKFNAHLSARSRNKNGYHKLPSSCANAGQGVWHRVATTTAVPYAAIRSAADGLRSGHLTFTSCPQWEGRLRVQQMPPQSRACPARCGWHGSTPCLYKISNKGIEKTVQPPKEKTSLSVTAPGFGDVFFISFSRCFPSQGGKDNTRISKMQIIEAAEAVWP